MTCLESMEMRSVEAAIEHETWKPEQSWNVIGGESLKREIGCEDEVVLQSGLLFACLHGYRIRDGMTA